MRANYRLKRLHVIDRLSEGVCFRPDDAQTHYLLHVMRAQAGDAVLVFNGIDGEWRAEIALPTRRTVELLMREQTRPQDALPDLHLLFAPLKVGRLDYLVQKAVEMGAGTLRPVMTEFTQNRHVSVDKLRAYAVEAAEQCGILALPEIRPPESLDAALADWDSARRLIFCDEDSTTQSPLDALAGLPRGPLAVLIGPEGGFSDRERAQLRALPFVNAIPLGPRILRADTAVVAALAVVQTVLGDWR